MKIIAGAMLILWIGMIGWLIWLSSDVVPCEKELLETAQRIEVRHGVPYSIHNDSDDTVMVLPGPIVKASPGIGCEEALKMLKSDL